MNEDTGRVVNIIEYIEHVERLEKKIEEAAAKQDKFEKLTRISFNLTGVAILALAVSIITHIM